MNVKDLTLAHVKSHLQVGYTVPTSHIYIYSSPFLIVFFHYIVCSFSLLFSFARRKRKFVSHFLVSNNENKGKQRLRTKGYIYLDSLV